MKAAGQSSTMAVVWVAPLHFFVILDRIDIPKWLFGLWCLTGLLHRKYSGNFLVNMLGKWKEIGGLAYYVTAPSQGND
ncbi:unnamed protein product [Lactuca virosa]|uniref:Uncharacterized protein n=1 Tax=Lactuca virosa TaxID=75947 RepID=A0AAU9MCJ9_9ASTR|nr:unnamed protein product [Lactuca virosa]